MTTAAEVNIPPGPGWNAQGAFNLPDIWCTIEKFKPANFAMPTATFVAIFFEETACCNMLQQKTPAAAGPGQLQCSEDDKIAFFACDDPNKDNFLGEKFDSTMTLTAVNQANGQVIHRKERLHPDLPELTRTRILSDNDFSVKMHVKFFQWLTRGFGSDGKQKGFEGLLGEQTGGNKTQNEAFRKGGELIGALMTPDPRVKPNWTNAQWKAYFPQRRMDFVLALNSARKAIQGNAVPLDNTKFWEFFLPEGFLQSPTGYMTFGY